MQITAKIEVTPDNLVAAVAQLERAEFEQFFQRLITLRSRNIATALTDSEETLIKRIYSSQMPATAQRRLLALAEKSERGVLSADAEWEEYGQLAERSEALNVQRITAAIELAALREQTLDETLQELGLLNDYGE